MDNNTKYKKYHLKESMSVKKPKCSLTGSLKYPDDQKIQFLRMPYFIPLSMDYYERPGR
jgi:hypothetical protein